MTEDVAIGLRGIVDSQISIFVSQVSEAFARHPDFDSLPYPQARSIAEDVRRPWRQGGPVMAETREMTMPEGGVRVRIHDPIGAGAQALKPALVYLHGGGWTLFSLDTHDRVMREYAARGGFVVIGVDYALSPEAKFPVALEQVLGAIRWLRDQGASIGVDPDRLAIGGDSAGANLSMAACLALRDAGEGDAIRGVLSNYGAYDSDCSDAAEQRFGGAGFVLNRAEMQQYWSNYLRKPSDAENPLACPIHARLEGLPPVLLAVAECDVLAEQNFVMAAKLAKAGVLVETIVYRGATHSFLEAMSIADLSNRALDDGARWVRDRTAAATADVSL